jgi:hypothetical protein
MKFLLILSLGSISSVTVSIVKCENNTPILMWFGFLAEPKNYLDYVKVWIRNNTVGDVYIKTVDLNLNGIDGAAMTVFVHPSTQINMVCEEIKSDRRLANGFHAIGVSQGGQFLYDFKNLKIL